jgi:hypothetical protein
MANGIELPQELIFKKDWIWDPPPPFLQKMEIRDIAQLAVIQLRMQHGMLKLQEEALEETIKIVQGYADVR